MEIFTPRLEIRNLRCSDWKAVQEIWLDADASPYAKYDAPHTTDDDGVKRLVESFCETDDFYIVQLINTDTVIGTIDIHDTGNGSDIGYCFISGFHGKGYAKESCHALIDHYFLAGVKRFTAGTALLNAPSVGLLKSLGFRQTAAEKVSFYKNETGEPVYFDGGIFELAKEDWKC